MRIGVATDHGGFGLKKELVAQLRAAGHDVVDVGAQLLDSGDDYPDYVIPLAWAVAEGNVDRGVAICGSGVGASICANKILGSRAALIHDHFSARQGVEGSHEHPLHGRPHGGRPWPGISSRRFSQPSSVELSGTCAASAKWPTWTGAELRSNSRR